jgi:hypothetical protein
MLRLLLRPWSLTTFEVFSFLRVWMCNGEVESLKLITEISIKMGRSIGNALRHHKTIFIANFNFRVMQNPRANEEKKRQ